jgi:hypothetical protein
MTHRTMRVVQAFGHNLLLEALIRQRRQIPTVPADSVPFSPVRRNRLVRVLKLPVDLEVSREALHRSRNGNGPQPVPLGQRSLVF